jgi:ADP-ribose pyrophosphatase
MKIIKTETLFNGKYLRLKRKYFQTREGKKGVWEFIEPKTINQRSVIIFALTKQKEVILEKIFRVPFEKFSIELPAGRFDKKGEKEIEVARKELLEETGYKAKKLILVLRGKISSSTLEEMSFYFAPNVELVGKPSLEEGEEIEILKIPLNKLVNFILNPPKNTKIDVKILSILPILREKKLI